MLDIGTISLILFVGMLLLLAIGMPLGFASGFLAVVVMFLRFGPERLLSDFGTGPLNILAQRMYGLTTDYVLISVPLFIFMASLLERSGIARDMYSSLNVWLSRTRGGIAIVTAIMAIVMAAMSGIIGGEVVLLGLIALPQMLRLGYNQNLAIGTICASGSLGTMIPPSIVLIMYGLITETSIHALFKAAFLPGFILESLVVAGRLDNRLRVLAEHALGCGLPKRHVSLPEVHLRFDDLARVGHHARRHLHDGCAEVHGVEVPRRGTIALTLDEFGNDGLAALRNACPR